MFFKIIKIQVFIKKYGYKKLNLARFYLNKNLEHIFSETLNVLEFTKLS